MDAYFDSAIIVKLYVQEATSPDAIQLVGAYTAPYSLTQWQALEVKNAIRLKVFRGEISAAEMNQSVAAFEQDIPTAFSRLREVKGFVGIDEAIRKLSVDSAPMPS